MDPPELASEPPQSRIGAASNSAPHLRVLGGVMLGAKEGTSKEHLNALKPYEFAHSTPYYYQRDEWPSIN
jgi:hypothetical protein